MADEDPGLRREFEQAPDGTEQCRGVAAREVGARRADIRHEQGVAREDRVTDLIGHAGGRVAGHGQHAEPERARHEGLAVAPQPVELRAVAAEVLAGVEDLTERLLHLDDARADADAAAELPLEVGRGGQVVRMRVRLEDPFDAQRASPHEADDGIGGSCARTPGFRVVVEHRIDDDAGRAVAGVHHVGDGRGGGIEEGLDLRIGGAAAGLGHGVISHEGGP